MINIETNFIGKTEISDLIKQDKIIDKKMEELKEVLEKMDKKDKEKINATKSIIKQLEKAREYLHRQMQLYWPTVRLAQLYPKYYKVYKKRFETFYDYWSEKISNKVNIDKLKTTVFTFGAATIIERLETNTAIKDIIIAYEKSKDKKDKKNDSLILDLIEKIFELPELIIASLGNESAEWKEKQKKFRGNSLEKRNSKNLFKYTKTAKLIGIMETDYKYLKGIQTKACEMTNCNDKGFSKWINSSKYNNEQFHNWKKNIKDEERTELKKEIEAYIKK